MTRARTDRVRSVAKPVVPSVPDTPWEEVDICFREFREAAVRLVERVNDLMASARAPTRSAHSDVALVRSVFGKWSMEILVALHTMPSSGFEDLRRTLDGISPRVLSVKLKGLERHGMIRREIIESWPPRVRYTLTDQGWTVAWLSDPVLLFLEQCDLRGKARPGATESRPAA
ncbi:MAG: helix-turn-helix domain-containing protein [Thermoplasmata archaeon]